MSATEKTQQAMGLVAILKADLTESIPLDRGLKEEPC